MNLMMQRSNRRARQRWAIGMFAGALLGAAACGGGGGGGGSTPLPDNDQFVGAIPKAEFDAQPVPSYALLADAYGRTLRDDPTALHLDAPRFSQKLFDTVKSLTTSGTVPSRTEDSGESLLSLSAEEWRFAIAEPVETYQTYLTKQQTENTIDEIYGQEGRQRNDKVDAFRLSYWNALSVQKLKGILIDPQKAVDFMKRLSEAHIKGGQSPREIQMDKNNGTVGRKVGFDNIYAAVHELKTICSTVPAEYLAPDVPINQFDFRTVYFTGVTNLDGTWTGQLTNKDSQNPAPWDATLYVNVFDGKIRGEMHLFRGNEYALRRFTGTTDFSKLEISFLYPYKFEIGDTSPCIGMYSTLNSGSNKLVGTWEASSCPQGGDLTLERGVRSAVRRPTSSVNTGCPCSG